MLVIHAHWMLVILQSHCIVLYCIVLYFIKIRPQNPKNQAAISSDRKNKTSELKELWQVELTEIFVLKPKQINSVH